MTDREKVIWSLARCSCGAPDACSDCHYDNWPPRICVQHLTNDALALLKAQEPITGETSDGYHTFNELYHHRAVLFSVIVGNYPDKAWKSKAHHDGTMYDGMFIVGIDTPDGQATYHYDIDPYWDMFKCRVLDNAPEWDGHTPAQAIERIGKLKAQEPRVFNVGDFYGEEFGYLEYRPNTPGFCDFEPCPVLIADIDDENVTVVFRSAAVLKLPLDKVNRSWRIWSDYPSHELLKAVEWE